MLAAICIFALSAFWYVADRHDYFKGHYNDLSEEQGEIFKWKDGDTSEKLMGRYRQYFSDSEYTFPRQSVSKVKMFKNIPMLGILTGKTLHQNLVDRFVEFCNDTANFTWAETTWEISESEYYFKLYSKDNDVVGKVYFCLEDCGMTHARPFCPSMKFGMLSENGLIGIRKLINSKDNRD